jgi:hypothetical protein
MAEERSGPNYTVISTSHTRKRRGFETARDMVLSMSAIVGVVAVILLLNYRPNPEPIREVEWQPVVSAARDSLDWPVLAPADDLPGWLSTSARNERTTGQDRRIHIGWITAQGQFASLQQTTQSGPDLDTWLRQTTQRGRADSPPTWTDAGARTWDRLASIDGTHRSLVASQSIPPQTVTYVISGSADWVELERLANSLRAQ